MENSNKLILVDGNNFACRFFFRGRKKGIILPMANCFLDLLFILRSSYPDSDVIMVWDEQSQRRMELTRVAKQRRLIESGYKELRKSISDQDKTDMLASLGIIKHGLLPLCRIMQVTVKGFEGDDVINSYCHKYPDREKVICSTDRDFYRILNENTIIDSINEKGVYTVERFIKDHGFAPELYTHYGAIVGEGGGGDNIPGVSGCGEAFAKEVVSLYGNLSSIRTALEQKSKLSLKERSFLDSEEIMNLSFSLKKMDITEVPDLNFENKDVYPLRAWMIENGLTAYINRAKLLV